MFGGASEATISQMLTSGLKPLGHFCTMLYWNIQVVCGFIFVHGLFIWCIQKNMSSLRRSKKPLWKCWNSTMCSNIKSICITLPFVQYSFESCTKGSMQMHLLLSCDRMENTARMDLPWRPYWGATWSDFFSCPRPEAGWWCRLVRLRLCQHTNTWQRFITVQHKNTKRHNHK